MWQDMSAIKRVNIVFIDFIIVKIYGIRVRLIFR